MNSMLNINSCFNSITGSTIRSITVTYSETDDMFPLNKMSNFLIHVTHMIIRGWYSMMELFR